MCSIDCREDGRLWEGNERERERDGQGERIPRSIRTSIRSRVTLIARNPASGSLAAVLVVARLRVSLRSRTETDARFASSAIGSNRDRTSATDVNLPFCASNESPQRKSAEDRDPFLPAIPTFPFDSPPIARFLPFLFSSSSPDSSPPEHARNGRFLLFDHGSACDISFPPFSPIQWVKMERWFVVGGRNF